MSPAVSNRAEPWTLTSQVEPLRIEAGAKR